MLTILSFIVVLGVIIFVHELGHFLAAKSVGIRVETFSLGYPPKMFGRKVGDTEYCLSWLPLGGYVKMSGMIDEGTQDESTLTGAPYEFASKNGLQKMWVILAGVLMNFILAVLIYTGITAAMGVPEAAGPFVGGISPGTPAAEAGMEVGDRILSIDGVVLETWDDLLGTVHPRPAEDLAIVWNHEGEEREAVLTTLSRQAQVDGEWTDVGLIGISPQIAYRSATAREVLVSGFQGTYQVIYMVKTSLVMLFTGRASVRDLGGPVLIAKMSGDSAREGLPHFLAFLAFISVNIGCLNLLPVPALDGGHAIIILSEAVIRRPLPNKFKIALQQVGMLLLLALIIFIVWNDVQRVFGFEWLQRIFGK